MLASPGSRASLVRPTVPKVGSFAARSRRKRRLPQPVTTVSERENGTNCIKNDASSEYDGRVVEVTEKRLSGIPADRQAEYVEHLRPRIEAMGFQRDDSGALRTSAHFTNPTNKFTGSTPSHGGQTVRSRPVQGRCWQPVRAASSLARGVLRTQSSVLAMPIGQDPAEGSLR
ncbi:hypothetical protein ACH4E7_44615 [Kitasatospora sp. NPDC018058]|uniref:hypothetical protein n=1 Tax=Kitasatospora sp. NPDC018058 TaxID=3364025 RepID=UPI0037BEDFEF